jgi:heme-degrading monooxygenase HmoA
VIRATLSIRVKAGREAEFERAWRMIAERVRAEPGNVRQPLLRDPSDHSDYVIASDWESREAFTRFERSPAQDELTAPIRELRASASMTVREIVSHLESGERGDVP